MSPSFCDSGKITGDRKIKTTKTGASTNFDSYLLDRNVCTINKDLTFSTEDGFCQNGYNELKGCMIENIFCQHLIIPLKILAYCTETI